MGETTRLEVLADESGTLRTRTDGAGHETTLLSGADCSTQIVRPDETVLTRTVQPVQPFGIPAPIPHVTTLATPEARAVTETFDSAGRTLSLRVGPTSGGALLPIDLGYDAAGAARDDLPGHGKRAEG